MKLPTEPGSVQKLNINPNEVIKIEAVDDEVEETQGDQMSKTDQSIPGKSTEESENMGAALSSSSHIQSSSASSSPSHTALPSTPTSQSVHSPLVKDDGSESSSSVNEAPEVKYSDTVPPEGLSLDSDLSNLTGIPGESVKMDTSESKTSAGASDDQTGTEEMDPNVNIKVEAITESELDLEITGVEPGQMAQSDNWVPNVQTRMGYGPSTSTGAQGDLADGQGNPGYSKFINIFIWYYFQSPTMYRYLVLNSTFKLHKFCCCFFLINFCLYLCLILNIVWSSLETELQLRLNAGFTAQQY